MKRALIFVAIPTHFREMIRVAQLLRSSGRYEPIVLFATLYGTWERDAAICRESGLAVHALYLDGSRIDWADCGTRRVENAAGGQEPAPRDHELVAGATGTPSAPVRKSFSERLPAFIRPHFRRVWRRIYKAYLDYRAPRWLRLHMHRRLQELFLARLLGLILLSRVVLKASTIATVRGDVAGPVTALGRKLTAAFGNIWKANPERLPSELRMKWRLYRALPALLQQHRIEMLVVPEDNFFLNTHFFIDAAHRTAAPAVIVPFTIANSLEWVESLSSNPECRVRWPLSLLLARAFPNWTYQHKGQTLIMPAEEILMNEYLGLTPPRPWLMNSGFADALTAEGPYMADYYRRAGIDPARIAVTGSVADDEIHAALSGADQRKSRLYSELDLPRGNPMLLISVPPNQLDGDGRPQCEFRTYETLLRRMLEAACGCAGWNVVLSLHPRIHPPLVEFIREFPCRVAEGDIASLVPLCDLFVASASATIRLAISAGRPVVNYDVFRYRYTDYERVPGVRRVEDFQAFQDEVRTLTRDPARLEALTRAQRRFAAEQALADGRSGERLLALFDRLTAKGDNARARQLS